MNTQIIFAGVEEAHLLTAGIIKPILLVHGRDIGSSQIRISFEPIAPRAQLQKNVMIIILYSYSDMILWGRDPCLTNI